MVPERANFASSARTPLTNYGQQMGAFEVAGPDIVPVSVSAASLQILEAGYCERHAPWRFGDRLATGRQRRRHARSPLRLAVA